MLLMYISDLKIQDFTLSYQESEKFSLGRIVQLESRIHQIFNDQGFNVL